MKINYINENSNNLAICITIPKTIKWEDYQKELDTVAYGKQEMNFKVAQLPTKVKVGDRCYLCYNNQIIGWMRISYLGPKNFDSTVGNKHWEGLFISRTGPLNKLKYPIPCKGFRGYKYINF